MTDIDRIALNNCDREPVHIPGRIQSFGALLAFDIQTEQVVAFSENLSSLFGGIDDATLGMDLGDLLGSRETVHALRGALGLPSIRSQRERIGVFKIHGQSVDVAVFETDGGRGVLELEPESSAFLKPKSPVAFVRSILSTVETGAGELALLETATKALRQLTQHDRVMAYRFLENGDGEVVAEAKAPGIEPYLGLRYPAWDIPVQVRQLMLRSSVRVIHDVQDAHAGLTQLGDSSPIDLTLSHLRGVSPIHLEYLENMGVRSTMNIALIVHGKLWGLFAFHHYRPRLPDPDQRSLCELFGQLLSMMIQQELDRERMERSQGSRSVIDALADGEYDLEALVGKYSVDLMRIMDCHGLGVIDPDRCFCYGDAPEESVLRVLSSQAAGEVVSTDNLASVGQLNSLPRKVLRKTAGVLLLRLPQDAWLAFFRNEVLHQIRWAGGKEKVINYGPNGPRLSPRGSFQEYKESVSGKCLAWSEHNLNTANEMSSAIWKMALTSTAEQSKRLQSQKRYQDLLIAELNHRVRNTIALVRSIARQTSTSSVSLEQYVEMLEQRLAALSRAHDLIGGSGLQWARIEDLLRGKLKPFEDAQHNVSLKGPNLAVRADVAPILSLLFHEMSTNAAKHGVLSGCGGTLSVGWRVESGGVAIDWLEDFPQEIAKPEELGFGFTLIERALPFECNGKSTVEWEPRALRVSFWLPLESTVLLEEIAVEAETEQVQSVVQDATELSHLEKVLVVEDNLVLAMELERTLLHLGVGLVDSLPNIQLAQESLTRMSYDCAILDINLGESTSLELAEQLLEARTPFVLASGYDSKFDLPKSLRNAPRLVKPIHRSELVHAIEQATQVAFE